MIGYVTLPSNFVSLVSANAGTIFTDLAPVAMLIAGVLLGLFVINWIIEAIQNRGIETSEDISARWKKAEEENDYRDI